MFGERGHFVSLPNHPELQQHSITVANDGEQIRSTVRVVRGTPVVFRVSVAGQELPGARVLLHDLDREYRTDIGMGDRVEREVRLVAGRWTARVDPVPGYLLTSVEVNRTIFPNDLAEFDLPQGTQAWYVNFEFAAQAHIWGKVIFEDDPFGVSIVSHLQEAGPWLPAVSLGDSDKAQVGDEIVAIGCPVGFEQTVATGRISRGPDPYGTPLLQTTVPATPGDDGGPVFNVMGEVIGMTISDRITESNRALPINHVRIALAKLQPK